MFTQQEILNAIQRVIAARKSRGATPEAIESFKVQMIKRWDRPEMQADIEKYYAQPGIWLPIANWDDIQRIAAAAASDN